MRRKGCAFSLLNLFLLFVLTSCSDWRRARDGSGGITATSRSIHILNKSGYRVDVFWVNPLTGELAHSNTDGEGLTIGAETRITSFVGHEFEVQELKGTRGQTLGKCRGKKCKSARFHVTARDDQTFTIWKNFTITTEDHRTRAMSKAKATVQDCVSLLQGDPSKASLSDKGMDVLTDCMTREVKKLFDKSEAEVTFQEGVRMDMGRSLIQYACVNDTKLNLTSTYARNMTWTYDDPTDNTGAGVVEYKLQTLFESAKSTALLVEDFVSPKQCKVLEQYMVEKTGADLSNSNVTLPVPDEAKAELQITRLLLKVQSLVKASAEDRPRFEGNLMTLQFRRHERAPSCDSSQQQEDGECAANLDNEFLPYETHWVPGDATGTFFFICSSSGGAVHFPRTGVHIPASRFVGSAVLLLHVPIEKRSSVVVDENNLEDGMPANGDVYLGEYALCLPQEVGTNMTIFTDSFKI